MSENQTNSPSMRTLSSLFQPTIEIRTYEDWKAFREVLKQLYEMNGRWTCPLCNKYYKNYRTLLTHLKNVHGISRSYVLDKSRKQQVPSSCLLTPLLLSHDPAMHIPPEIDYIPYADEYTIYDIHYQKTIPLLLIGKRGTGKTTSILSWAFKRRIPVVFVDCATIGEKDAVGYFNGNTQYVFGILPLTVMLANRFNKCLLLLENLDKLNLKLQFTILEILRLKRIVLHEISRVIHLRGSIVVFATIDSDDNRDYEKSVCKQLFSIFSIFMWKYNPSSVVMKYIEKVRNEKLRSVLEVFVKSLMNNNIQVSVADIRMLIQLASTMIKHFPLSESLKKAVEFTIVNKLDEERKKQVYNILNSSLTIVNA